MLANNLDVINLAIFEHQEMLRRSFPIAIDDRRSPWEALRSRISRFFGAPGGEAIRREPETTAAGGAIDRPALTLMHLPATVTEEARDRAA